MTGLKLLSKLPWLRLNLNMFSWSCLEHKLVHHITLDSMGPLQLAEFLGKGWYSYKEKY